MGYGHRRAHYTDGIRTEPVVPHRVLVCRPSHSYGERATVALTDGSLVHLNTQSALSVTLSSHRRSLSLKQGEALFEVAHDPARPFDVAVNGRVVRAIGTIFNIEHDGHRTIVSVLEGAVRLFEKRTSAKFTLVTRSSSSTSNEPPRRNPSVLLLSRPGAVRN